MGVCEHKNEELQQCELGLWASVGPGNLWCFLVDWASVAGKWDLRARWGPEGPRGAPRD